MCPRRYSPKVKHKKPDIPGVNRWWKRPKTRIGSANATALNDTSVGTGTFVAGLTGSVSETQDAQISVASGDYAGPTASGSLSETQEDQTSTGSGGLNNLIWENDFEAGLLNGIKFSSEAGTLHDIITDPTGRSSKVLRMTGDTSDGTNSGNRARLQDFLYEPGPEPETCAGNPVENLPFDGIYEIWFYLATNFEHVNMFQWKQAYSLDWSDPLNRPNQTRRLLYYCRLDHQGGGEHRLRLRTGYLDPNNGDLSLPGQENSTALAEAPFTVSAGQWHHMRARYVFAPDNNGSIEVWMDGVKWCDLQNIWTQGRICQDASKTDLWGPGGDPLPGQPTYVEKLLQHTANNYMITSPFPHNPAQTTLYFDDWKIWLT